MSSLKALISKKKVEARLSHPYARYSTSNQLTCSICGLAIKHANLWSGHLLSKGHRQKEREQLKREEQERSKKRKREEEAEEAEEGGDGGKRKRDDDEDGEDGDEHANGGSSLPADFFADPSMAPSKRAETPEEEAGVEVPVEVGEGEDDDEWAAFEASLAERPPAIASTANATIFAEPVLYEFGAPVVKEEGEEADAAEEEEEEAETEEEKQERLDREEREEYMERIMEETRLQQEADDKVDALKKKLELLRQNRKKKV